VTIAPDVNIAPDVTTTPGVRTAPDETGRLEPPTGIGAP